MIQAEFDAIVDDARRRLFDAAEAIPPAVRSQPGVAKVLDEILDYGRQSVELLRTAERAGRRQLWIGLLVGAVVGIPIGIFSNWIGSLLGIG